MNEIYVNDWNPLQHFFIPIQKLISKERIDSKVRKKYSIPKTPYQRFMELDSVHSDIKNRLRERKAKLNPIYLRMQIEIKLKEFSELTKELVQTEKLKLAARELRSPFDDILKYANKLNSLPRKFGKL